MFGLGCKWTTVKSHAAALIDIFHDHNLNKDSYKTGLIRMYFTEQSDFST